MTATYYGRRYKGVKLWKDRHGKPRCTYRLTGVNLPIPGSVTFRIFDQAYWAAAGAKGEKPAPPPRPATSPDGTVEKGVAAYLAWLTAEAEAGRVPDDTMRSRRSLLGVWARANGDKRLSTLRKEHIEAGMQKRKDTPTTAKNWLYAVRTFYNWLIAEKRYGITENPTLGVALLERPKTGGFKPWAEPDVARFCETWKPGTMEHRALMVLLWCGQRRTDVVKFGWHKCDGDFIVFVQQKTQRRLKLPIPVHVRAILPPRPAANVAELHPLPFLVTNRDGKPFTKGYFTNWFREACQAAGLEGLGPHGCRKLAARRVYGNALRANRADAFAITMAFTGHKTETELRRYLGEDFEQEHYADEMVAFMGAS
jgi:integrase